jgi:hypothetical protein
MKLCSQGFYKWRQWRQIEREDTVRRKPPTLFARVSQNLNSRHYQQGHPWKLQHLYYNKYVTAAALVQYDPSRLQEHKILVFEEVAAL